MRRLVAALAGFLVLASSADAFAEQRLAEDLSVSLTPIPFFPRDPAVREFGTLKLLGSYRLASEHSAFGGFSGLVMAGDGSRLVAVSDDGWWFGATVERKDGAITGLSKARIAPLLDAEGKRPRSKIHRDAEALAPWDAGGIDGRLIVGFERDERVAVYDVGAQGFAARPRLVPSPKAISEGPENGELEAVGRLFEAPFEGWLIAVSESHFDPDGNTRGWLWKGSRTVPLKLKRHGDYRVTDLAILPGGRSMVTVERSFVPPLSLGMTIRRFELKDLEAGAPAEGELLLEARWPGHTIDNMEAIAAWPRPEGGVVLTVLSDDNYNRSIQRTLLLEFVLLP
ncbi:MAG: esterase-like activity of phytase family protein [Parvibaculaceae bacterium]